MKCTNSSCSQKPELRQTGWGSPHADYECPVCKHEYYSHNNGVVSDERPFKWTKKAYVSPGAKFYFDKDRCKDRIDDLAQYRENNLIFYHDSVVIDQSRKRKKSLLRGRK